LDSLRATLYINRANSLYELRRYNDAQDDVEMALSLKPRWIQATSLLVKIKAEAKKQSEVADQNNNQVENLRDQGNNELFSGHYGKALDFYLKALAIEKSGRNHSDWIAILLNDQGMVYFKKKMYALYCN
jgi:tetratricopeptide (TPR) repeat protein